MKLKQIEKDIVFLSSIGMFAKGLDMKIEDVIPNYNKDKVMELTHSLPMSKTDENIMKALKEAAHQVYKRVEKKFTT